MTLASKGKHKSNHAADPLVGGVILIPRVAKVKVSPVSLSLPLRWFREIPASDLEKHGALHHPCKRRGNGVMRIINQRGVTQNQVPECVQNILSKDKCKSGF